MISDTTAFTASTPIKPLIGLLLLRSVAVSTFFVAELLELFHCQLLQQLFDAFYSRLPRDMFGPEVSGQLQTPMSCSAW